MLDPDKLKVTRYDEYYGGYILQFNHGLIFGALEKPSLTPFEYAVTKELDFFIFLN